MLMEIGRLGRRSVLVVGNLGLLFGCATASAPPPAAGNQMVTISCEMPNSTPLQETKEIQTKGGIQIIVAMQPFQCTRAFKETTAPGKVSFGEAMVASQTHKGQRFVETTRTPYFVVKPERMKVTLKVVNQLPRVFRGAGTVAQFTVAGKTWANKQENYAEFSNVIVPPRGETTNRDLRSAGRHDSEAGERWAVPLRRGHQD